MWGQTDYSGIWYIANETNHSNNNFNTHWYLVPGADPQQPHYADAYFNDQYCNTSGSGDYTGDNYGDSGKPFLTTYQTKRDLNSVWIIVSTGDGYYNIIHAKTGKYVVYEPPYQEAMHRKSVHLESTTTPGDNAKFTLTGSSLSGPININPKSVTSGNMYFNPAVGVGNRLQYYGTGDYFHEGMIGLYSGSTDKSQWYFEDASSASSLTPVISDVDETNNTFTITSPAAAFSTIRYTTDGSTTPNASTGTTATSGSDINITGSWSVQAVGVFGTFITPVAGPKTINPVYCKTPVFTYSTETGKVTITSETSNASIYYTLNGVTPTSGSTLYEGPFEVANLTTIKAIAIKTGFLDSEIAFSKLVLNPTITLAENTYTYDGSAKEPAVSSVKDVEELISPDEYNVSYSNHINVGDGATVSITNKAGGSFIVYGSTTFTINPKTVTITANNASKTYDGTALTDDGFTTTALETGDTHIFTVVMTAESTITNVGTQPNVIASVDGIAVTTGTETAVGNYLVTTANGTLKINPKSLGDGNNPADGISIVLNSDGTLNSVKDGSTTLVANQDYISESAVEGADNVVIVTGMGNYTGSAKGIYACPKFTDPDGTTGSSKAAAVYMALRDYAKPAGITPYIVRKVNPSIGTMVISEIAYIPEGVPVLLLSDTEVSGFTVSPKDEAVPEIPVGTKNSNQLKVAPEEGVAVEAAQVYMFYKGEFVLTKAGTLTEGKFYLYNPNYAAVPDGQGSANGSRSTLQYVIEEWDDSEETTGMISTTPAPSFQQEGSWYTLDGRCLSGEPTKSGIYIRKGQKVYIKKK